MTRCVLKKRVLVAAGYAVFYAVVLAVRLVGGQSDLGELLEILPSLGLVDDLLELLVDDRRVVD